MNIELEPSGNAQVIHVIGELIGDDDAPLVAEATNLLTSPEARVIIELSKVPYMNSTGLSELVRITAQANVQEARVALASPSPFVEGVLQTTQLDRFFEVYASVDEAIAGIT